MEKNPITTLREERGLSQVELGLLLGISAAQVSQFERDVIWPSARCLSGLAELLEVDRETLVTALATWRELRRRRLRAELAGVGE